MMFRRVLPTPIGSTDRPSTPPVVQAPRALYLEFIERNRDNFLQPLFVEADAPARRPFSLAGSEVVVDRGVQAALAQGTQADDYRLQVDRAELDVGRDARLFLVHEVHYDGQGRFGGVSHFYIFSAWPAVVALPVFEPVGPTWALSLDESLRRTAAIRLLPAGAGGMIRLTARPDGSVEIASATGMTVVPPGSAVSLGTSSRTLEVTQDLLAPIPKGPVTAEEIRTDTARLGSITFSTELQATSAGWCEVRVE